MADRNQVTLIGRIGDAFKTGKTQNGSSYIWFPLNLEARANANSTDNNYYQTLHIMCFKKVVIDYLKRVDAHNGNTVIIFGFVSSFSNEVRGKRVIANAINANEIYVVKTKADN